MPVAKLLMKQNAEYQHELNEKGEKTGTVLGKHVIRLYQDGIYQVFEIRDNEKLQQTIEYDPIIKYQMPFSLYFQ